MRVGIGLEKIRAYLEESRPRHIQRIQRAVQQPSVSTEGPGVEECAQLLVEYHREVGFQEAEVVSTDGLPGLWGYYDAGAAKTIAVYNYFDTRPELPSAEWEHPPYSGVLTSTGPYEQVLMGRGSYAFKGPYVAWLNAVEALLAVEGTLPVNVMILLEGNEILGSPTYRQMFDRYRSRLETADACLCPGASQGPSGRVEMNLGYKGMIYADLVASGASWGRGPKTGPLHGMTKSVVDSPVWRLVHALATITEPDGNRVAVKGFYDDLVPPTEAERRMVQSYQGSLGAEGWKAVLPGVGSVGAPAGDLTDEETILAYFYGPSFNINGLSSGFTGPGTLPFTLPHEASARFDIRLPRGYSAQKVVQLIRNHLATGGYGDVELRVMGAYDPSTTDPNSELVRSMCRAFEEMDVPLAMAPCSGGGGPWSLYATELGLPLIRGLGVGGGGNTAGSNEYMVIDGTDTVGGLVECELSHVHMLKSYAKGSN